MVENALICLSIAGIMLLGFLLWLFHEIDNAPYMDDEEG